MGEKNQDYTLVFIIFLYVFVLRRLNFNLADSGDLMTVLLCLLIVVRSLIRIFRGKGSKQ